MKGDRIAAILTCHNRQQKTLECLTALFQQDCIDQINVDVYLTDDGSTDGTADAIREAYPQVKVLSGDGSLFWGGGMAKAFAAAVQGNYDYYLWLNDDTILYPDALSKLFLTYTEITSNGNTKVVITGSTRDQKTGEHTYGGVVRPSPLLRPLRFEALLPTDRPQPCETINGNCVLISRTAAQAVGNIDLAFTHYAGDFDYGLRSVQQGCLVYIPPGYVGTCSANDTAKAAPPMKEGLKKIQGPKGVAISDTTLHPIDEWKVFAQRYAGPLWPVYWLAPYRRLLLSSLKGKVSKDP